MSQPFEIRDVTTLEEFLAVEEIQRDAWGFADKEIVPQNVLLAIRSAGGLVLGAFLPEGEMGGFVFSIPGQKDGKNFHHSHMAAVRRHSRGSGIALALKREQRRRVLALGLDRIRWTYDPLEARNASFNCRKLGVVADRYVEDIYGLSSGFIHGGLPTDRVAVTWELDSPMVKALAEGVPPPLAPPPDAVKRANHTALAAAGVRRPVGWDLETIGPDALVEIPSDIQRLKGEVRAVAREWRMHIREGLPALFERGYSITGFFFDREGGRPFYLLTRSDPPGSRGDR